MSSIKEIAERAWAEIGADYNYPPDVASAVIERAIREAAAPLVDVLGRTIGRNVQDELSRKHVLIDWKASK